VASRWSECKGEIESDKKGKCLEDVPEAERLVDFLRHATRAVCQCKPLSLSHLQLVATLLSQLERTPSTDKNNPYFRVAFMPVSDEVKTGI